MPAPPNLISINSHTRHLGRVRRFVFDHARAAGLSQPDARAIQLAVDETCANTIKHAYGSRTSGIVEVEITVKNDSIFIVTVRHSGEGFDPSQYTMPSLERAFSEKRRGGYGLHLIHRLVDQVVFRENGGRCEVILTKKINSETPRV